jgi:2,3-bisphosphoglycerate-dependent phosphoglycerate mutase
MKQRITFFLLVLMSSHSLLAKQSVIYLVRHAEVLYTNGNNDPSLTEIGKERAKSLQDILKDEPITKVLATRFKRTQETAGPIARFKKLSIEIEDSNGKIVEEILSLKNEALLIASHSNSIPKILYLVGATKEELPEIDHSVFNKLFVFTIKEENNSKVVSLKVKTYGI